MGSEEISGPRKRWTVMTFLEMAHKLNIAFEIFIGIDDSLGEKGKATKHLEAVDYHHIETCLQEVFATSPWAVV